LKKKVSFTKIIRKDDLEKFIEISGDTNPIHLKKKISKQYRFLKRVVHGALIISYFSRLIGTKLPGKNSLILSSEYKFHSPIYLNDKVIIKGILDYQNNSTKTYELSISANVKKKLCVSGKIVCIKV
jgi:3-hydroxybutyryl-CoA dehydratase